MEAWFDPWKIWIAIGIICVIIEIFTPGFLFLSFGLGAIITGVLAFIIPSVTWQILIFAVVTLIVFILSRKLSKKLIYKEYEETNAKALIGKRGRVTRESPAEDKGYVKIGGEEWVAVSKCKIEKDAKVLIDDIEGNKVIVSKLEEE